MEDHRTIVGKGRADAAQRPAREDLLRVMLDGTRRSFVPIRRSFLQRPESVHGSRAAHLPKFARDAYALDSYLLVHALASSSEPYSATYPVATWIQVARLDEYTSASAAKTRWSKVVSRLVELRLVGRERAGKYMRYWLLDESGSGEVYARPAGTRDGIWFKLPYAYWLEGYDRELTHPEKLMLLIALDQREEFWLPFNQVAKWYGVSEATARRGLRGLEARGLLRKEESVEVSPQSPTGWVTNYRYSLEAPFSKASIGAAQARRRREGSLEGKSGDD